MHFLFLSLAEPLVKLLFPRIESAQITGPEKGDRKRGAHKRLP